MLASVAGVAKTFGSTIDQRDPVNTAVQQVLSQGNSTVNNLTANGTVAAVGDVTTSGNMTANGNVTATTGLVSGVEVQATGTTNATSTITGSLQSGGGLGVANDIYAGGQLTCGAQTAIGQNTAPQATIKGMLAVLDGANGFYNMASLLDNSMAATGDQRSIGIGMANATNKAGFLTYLLDTPDAGATASGRSSITLGLWGQTDPNMQMFGDGTIYIPCLNSPTSSSDIRAPLRSRGGLALGANICVPDVAELRWDGGVVLGTTGVHLPGATPTWGLNAPAASTTTGVTWTGGNNSWTFTSDAKLKENITPLDYGLNEVMRLGAVRYDWKGEKENKRIGLLAQDVQQVMPELVQETKEGHLGLNYTTLIPVLINAIKTQQNQLATMQRWMIEHNRDCLAYGAKKRKIGS